MEKQRNAQPPLVRLNLIQPFVEELDRRCIDPEDLMAQDGITRPSITDLDVFVPAIVIYRFVEKAASLADDPYLGVKIGESLDFSAWPPFFDSVTQSKTLIEFFTRFIRAVKKEASSAQHTLEIGQEHAEFREIRSHAPYIAPSQNDAFTVAVTLNILLRCVGTTWDPSKVCAKVCDVKALPKQYLGVHIAKCNRKGMAVEFPSDWLLKPIDLSRINNPKLMAKTGLDQLPDFISALKSIVDLHLDNPELNVDYVAQLFGTSRQSLQRLARSNGTTLVDEIKSLKIDRACNGLIATRKPIKEVAASVGFNSVASFSRAFKSWTNLSPQAYRRLNQAVI